MYRVRVLLLLVLTPPLVWETVGPTTAKDVCPNERTGPSTIVGPSSGGGCPGILGRSGHSNIIDQWDGGSGATYRGSDEKNIKARPDTDEGSRDRDRFDAHDVAR